MQPHQTASQAASRYSFERILGFQFQTFKRRSSKQKFSDPLHSPEGSSRSSSGGSFQVPHETIILLPGQSCYDADHMADHVAVMITVSIARRSLRVLKTVPANAISAQNCIEWLLDKWIKLAERWWFWSKKCAKHTFVFRILNEIRRRSALWLFQWIRLSLSLSLFR